MREIFKNIILLNPPRVGGVAFTREGRCQEREEVLGLAKPPFTLLVIASMLKEKGIDFLFVDANAENWGADEIVRHIRQKGFHPSCVIFPTTTPTLAADCESIRQIKEKIGSLQAFAFGAHVSVLPKKTLEEFPQLDGLFLGESERVLEDILESRSNGRPEEIKGFLYRQGESIAGNSDIAIVDDLNELPVPAWNLVNPDYYRLPITDERYLLVETSRSCPFDCDFCVVSAIHGLNFREKDVDRVVLEIKRALEAGIENINFWSPIFTLNKDYIGRLCDAIIGENIEIKWFANARADTLLDRNLARKMKQAGCWMLSVGIESFSDEVRETMSKKVSRLKIEAAIENLKQTGIKAYGFFIYGYLGETVKSMKKTTDWALKLGLEYVSFYPAVPYPGTRFYESCLENGWLTTDDWSKYEYSYYVIDNGTLNSENVKKEISRAYRKFFLRPKFIIGQIRAVGSLKGLAKSIAKGIRLLLWVK